MDTGLMAMLGLVAMALSLGWLISRKNRKPLRESRRPARLPEGTWRLAVESRWGGKGTMPLGPIGR